jgi:type IV secretion system pilin
MISGMDRHMLKGKTKFVAAIWFITLGFGFGVTPALADLKSEYDNCVSLQSKIFDPAACPRDTSGTFKSDACVAMETEYFYNGCSKIIGFHGQSEAGKDALCKLWKSEYDTVKSSQQAYDRVECSSREFAKTAAYSKATAEKCKTYKETSSVPGVLYDPSCIVSGKASTGCDAVLASECTSLGLGGAGALGATGIATGPEAEGDAQVARAEAALTAAIAKKLPNNVIQMIQAAVNEAKQYNAQLKELTKKEGTKPDYLVRANALVAKIKAAADRAVSLAGNLTPIEGSSMQIKNPLGTADLPTIIGRVIATFLGTVGGLSLLVFVYAGIRYMTAAGDEKAIMTAKDTMVYAFFGLLIIVFAYAITNFFFQSLLKG